MRTSASIRSPRRAPRSYTRSLIWLILLGFGGVAEADPADDGYCDYVEGVASATSDVQLAPQLIGLFGYVEQPPTQPVPTSQSTLRLIAGVNYRLTGIYEGVATRDRGHADCRRHRALEQVRGETMARALAAKAKVLADALAEADKVLEQTTADLDARRTTTQEATAIRLRVEELRGLDADARRQLSTLPTPGNEPLGAAMSAYHTADADMERAEAKLRRAQAFDISVRAGVDKFFDSTVANSTPYFALVSVGINFGALWQGSANDRAAAGRKRLVESGHDPLGVDANIERVKIEIEVETKRAEETQALVGELQRQLDALARVGGEDSKKVRQTVWFDFVKAKAEQAYLTAHLDALHQVLGGS